MVLLLALLLEQIYDPDGTIASTTVGLRLESLELCLCVGYMVDELVHQVVRVSQAHLLVISHRLGSVSALLLCLEVPKQILGSNLERRRHLLAVHLAIDYSVVLAPENWVSQLR